jgi:hypothetical protein
MPPFPSYEKFREMFPMPSGSHLQRFVSWIPKGGGCHDCVLHEYAKVAVTQLNLGTWGMDYLLCEMLTPLQCACCVLWRTCPCVYVHRKHAHSPSTTPHATSSTSTHTCAVGGMRHFLIEILKLCGV